MTWLWGLLAALALLWPDRISGPIDGVPLDRVLEAIAVGAILPVLALIQLWFDLLARWSSDQSTCLGYTAAARRPSATS